MEEKKVQSAEPGTTEDKGQKRASQGPEGKAARWAKHIFYDSCQRESIAAMGW